MEIQSMSSQKLNKKGFLQLENQYRQQPMGNIMEIFPSDDAEALKNIKEREKELIKKKEYNNNPVEVSN